MEFDTQQIIASTVSFAQQLEGPYKWYAITAIICFITAVITRLIFKTFKWFFFIVLLGGFLFGIFWGLAQLASF